jgi:hypothetical protein
MLLYSLWSTTSPFSSGSSVVAMLIVVDRGLSSVMFELLYQVLRVLGLMDEGTLLCLLHLDTYEKC